MIFSMSLGKRIQAARLSAGLTKPVELSTLTGISKQTISNLENNKVSKPDPVTLVKIASVTGVSLSWIITGTGLPKPKNMLSDAEIQLLDAFNSLQKSSQQEALNYIQFLSKK